jgi:DNA-binding PadR family transcriptional regulator
MMLGREGTEQMYELLVLALLMRWPLYAYLIASMTNHIMGPWEKISRGSLSALLKKWEQAGLIEPGDPEQVPFPSTRASRVYAITNLGQARFSQLMLDTTSNLGTYQRLFRIKALHMEFLPAGDQLYLLDHYLYYCRTGIQYLRGRAHEMTIVPAQTRPENEGFLTTALDLMEVSAQEWELELAWAQSLRDRLSVAATQAGSSS